MTTETPLLQAEEFRRMERKFLVDGRRIPFLTAWLGHTCRPDSQFPTGRVTSCYYDNRDWDSYFASRDGDFDKRKVRLRWYGELPQSGTVTAYIEVKEKDGFETWKRRLPVTMDASLLRSREFERALPPPQLHELLSKFGVLDAADLLPTLVISYHRRRYFEPFSNTSVSLDTAIVTRLATSRTSAHERSFGTSLIELKGRDIALPPRLKSMARFAPIWSSHSKYALAVETFVETGQLRV